MQNASPPRQGRFVPGAAGLLRPAFWAAVLWAGLAACAPGGAPEAPAWAAHRAQAGALEAWRMEGRLGVLHGGERWHIRVEWVLNKDSYKIDIHRPFGGLIGVIQGSPRGVVYRDARGGTRHARNPEALFTGILGFEMPVSALRYWALGLPAPGSPPRDVEARGERLSFNQAGWRVSCGDWRPAGGGRLPGAIRLERDGTFVSLRIGRWEVPPTASHAV